MRTEDKIRLRHIFDEAKEAMIFVEGLYELLEDKNERI